MKSLSSALAGMGTLGIAAMATAAAAQEAPATLADAIAAGKPILEARVRYEGVDQANLANEASAFTVRTRLGWETGAWNGLKGLVEFEDVRQLGDEDYNSTLNGKGTFPVIADPEVTELNRLQISWTPNKALTGTVGRQRIVLDDQRFVGAVGWRQDEQTFDAARADVSVGKVKVTTAWLGNINRIFGEGADWDSDSWIVNAAFAGPDAFKPTAFVYALDFDNARANSSLTYGVRVTGKSKAGQIGLAYAASYAHQSDYADNPASFDLDYWMLEGAATYGIATVKANFESLEGDGTKGFATPLATLHAFQGWADVFLTTPANGIEDTSVTLALAPKFDAWPKKLTLMVVAHNFEAQNGGADLGDEVDIQLAAPLTKRLTGVIKFADYDGVPGFASRQKFWVGVDFKL